MKPPIPTYSAEHFREAYMMEGVALEHFLKADFGTFFVIPVERMIRLMKLPVPPVRTSSHTFIYLTEGDATMRVGAETYTIYAHECLAVPAGQIFSFDHVDQNRGYLCNFHDDFIVGRFAKSDLLKDFEFLRVWGNPRIALPADVSGYVEQLFRRLLAEYGEHGLARPDIMQPYFIALLCEVNRAYKTHTGGTLPQAVQIGNRFRELLFAQVKTLHRVSDYADRLHVSPNHLNKTVKAATGKSPSQWIDEALLLEAKVLLHQSKLGINEVADNLGFDDASYFSRWFRKQEGCTPQGFRKKIEKS